MMLASFSAIAVGVAALTIVVLLLVFILMFAESKLVQQGKVKILINGDESKSPEVDAGGTLLSLSLIHISEPTRPY